MPEALVYTMLRLAFFVVSLLLFRKLGASPLLALVLAAVVSAALSYVLLRRQRDAVAAKLAERVQQRAASRAAGTLDPDAAAEDEAVDRAVAEGSSGGPQALDPTEDRPSPGSGGQREPEAEK